MDGGGSSPRSVFELDQMIEEGARLLHTARGAEHAEMVFCHGLAQRWRVGAQIVHAGGQRFLLRLDDVLAAGVSICIIFKPSKSSFFPSWLP